MIDQLLTLEALCPRAPMYYATSVPTEKVHYSMNLESVLGEYLQHYGIKRNVPFTNRTGSTMNVNFEVTDTKRAILSVHKGCGNGSQQILEKTPGFDIVYDRGAYVLDVDVNDDVYVNDERQKVESDSESVLLSCPKSIGNEP